MSTLARKLSKGVRLLADRRFRPGLFKGVAATIEHEAALRGYRFATVIDIGANRGQFTLLAAGLFPDAEIIAFEPLIGPYRRLFEVAAGLPHVRVVNAAIGASRCSLAMNVSRRDDSSSLLPIGVLQREIFPKTGHDHTEEVQVGPLGDHVAPDEIARPSLLKIDVQGYELEVLKGSQDLLERIDVIYVEASFVELYQGQPLAEEVIDALARQGFHEQARHNLCRDRKGRLVQADFLFERDDHRRRT
ncbi:MAG: FkbM family methyltransferase [Alphaproteobacteria bacterium]